MDQLWGLDVERIQRYLFSVNRLREIRSASHLLDALVTDRSGPILSKHGCATAIAAAGNLVAVVDDAEIAQLEAELGQLFHLTLPGLEFVTAHVVGSLPTFNNGMKKLAPRLAEAKAGKDPRAIFPHAGPMEYCGLCHAAPATERHLAPGITGKYEFLCADCGARARFNPNDTRLGTPLANLERKLIETAQNAVPGAWKVPDNLEELLTGEPGAHGTGRVEGLGPRQRYVGLIVADGNRMGAKWMGATLAGNLRQQAQAARTSSDAISDCVHQALAAALEDTRQFYWGRRGASGVACLPVMPLLVGGDDIVVLCRGGMAVAYAASLCPKFGELTAGNQQITGVLGQGGLSLSAGVVIAHHNFPLYRMREIAEDLTCEAKRLSDFLLRRGNGGEAAGAEYGTLSFLRITSAMFGDLGGERKGRIVKHLDGGNVTRVRKTCCPYVVKRSEQSTMPDVPDIQTLTDAVNLAQGLPSRRLHRAVEWLDLPPSKRSVTSKEETDRLAWEHKKTWKSILGKLGCSDDTLCRSNPRPRELRELESPYPNLYDSESPLPDLVDLEACYD